MIAWTILNYYVYYYVYDRAYYDSYYGLYYSLYYGVYYYIYYRLCNGGFRLIFELLIKTRVTNPTDSVFGKWHELLVPDRADRATS